MSKEQKPDARIGVTTRYTQEELNKLDWLAERLGCDRANAPRHLMSGYLVAHADLAEQYDRSKEAEHSRVYHWLRSHDPSVEGFNNQKPVDDFSGEEL